MKVMFLFILFAVIASAFMALGFWLANRLNGKLPFALRVLVILTMMSIGFVVGIKGPLRYVRVVTDTEFLSKGPFKTKYLKGTGPESQVVRLLIINSTGTYMVLDIDRPTRQVHFSRVYVPEEIQF